ncbi:MAG: hypothetical protein HY738_03950 [Bacteroidia bacterium]|nr:hypothetical protein [Bacteroidia bacterium]
MNSIKKHPKRKTNNTVESLWICNHPEEVYKYEGKWIVVVGEKIVSHGEDLEKVINEAKKYGEPLKRQKYQVLVAA